MIILSIWMANILHTMHKCARVFLRGEGEVASPCITPYPGSRARISESVTLAQNINVKALGLVLSLSSNHWGDQKQGSRSLILNFVEIITDSIEIGTIASHHTCACGMFCGQIRPLHVILIKLWLQVRHKGCIWDTVPLTSRHSTCDVTGTSQGLYLRYSASNIKT